MSGDNVMISSDDFFAGAVPVDEDACLQDLLEPRRPKRRRAAPEYLLDQAKSGDMVAQFELGQHYYDMGNDVSARKWLSRAAAQDLQNAIELLALMDAEDGAI